MAGFIALLHIVGWGTLILLVAPEHWRVQGAAFGLGTGLLAYTLGMRHAFDADHIAAVDNTTRKLMSEGKRPLTVGFWFSLGHSTVVCLMTVLLVLGVKAIGVQVSDDDSLLHSVGGLVGTAVSGGFLYLIGVLNLIILVGIIKVFRQMRHGDYDEAALQEQLDKRGFMNRILRGLMNSVTEPWHIYPIGVLFGVGFDTFTSVAFMVLAGSGIAAGIPWYAVMCLPVLFTAGMALLDTVDGVFMNFAYGWAFAKPIRKVYYNITITGLSVAVALLVGTIELLAILQDRLGLHGFFWDAVAGVDLNKIGYFIVGLFVVTWVVALGVWKLGRVEQRWSAEVQEREEAVVPNG
ncbi:HoxN/HupN/NixA family nickel/cobalt transporter [Streptomyces sp. NPDC005374]|uniref:HoxN/HupN/NixA family nickel/cobalt transporter n=1 Tax=Streptomyces sp. NPDC005374 TaxID=3364713 RepID=UPI0036A1E84D